MKRKYYLPLIFLLVIVLFASTGCSDSPSGSYIMDGNDKIPVPPKEYVKLDLEVQPIVYHNTVSMSADSRKVMAIKTDGSAWINVGTPEESKVMEQAVAVYHFTNVYFILQESGTLWAWGSDNIGGVGNRTSEEVYESYGDGIKVEKPLVVMENVKAIGGYYAALQNNGDLYQWGIRASGNFYGQPELIIGLPELSLHNVSSFSKMTSLLAIQNDNSLWASGENKYGQLGLGFTSSDPIIEPVKVKENIQRVWSDDSTYALDMDGTLWGAGYNPFGEVGTHETQWEITSFSPILENVADFSAGSRHCAAVTSDGRLWAWGNNRSGELGIGKNMLWQIHYPVYVMDQVVRVYAKYNHTAAIKSNGSLWAWGNFTIEDDGTKSSHYVPVKLADDVHSVYDGYSEIVFLKNDGTLWMWEDTGEPVMIMEDVRLPF